MFIHWTIFKFAIKSKPNFLNGYRLQHFTNNISTITYLYSRYQRRSSKRENL